MDKHNRDHKKTNNNKKKPVDKNPKYTPEKRKDEKVESRKA